MPLEEPLEIYRSLARGQLMIVPGTGHNTFDARPDLLNSAIRTFLEQPGSENLEP
jgi:pimeloyl-ACP methyl ester carboxylesterase